jgi:hypothetical protein
MPLIPPPTYAEFTALVNNDFETVYAHFPHCPDALNALTTFKSALDTAVYARSLARRSEDFAREVFTYMSLRSIGEEIPAIIHAQRLPQPGSKESPIIINDDEPSPLPRRRYTPYPQQTARKHCSRPRPKHEA